MLEVKRNAGLNCADVLDYVHLSSPHDVLEKVTTFDIDGHIFPHLLSIPDVCVSGLDFRPKILDLYAVADSQWGFLSGTIRAGSTWTYGFRFLNPSYALDLEVLDFSH